MTNNQTTLAEKTYTAHLFEIDTNTKFKVKWTMRQFALAEHIARCDGWCIIPNRGYFYRFDQLKSALERMGADTINYYLCHDQEGITSGICKKCFEVALSGER